MYGTANHTDSENAIDMGDIQYLDSSIIKREEVHLLRTFRNICTEHGLRYALCGGTLLGAIRHKGFIPWDDDIDVNMPRPDYDKLWELADSGVFDEVGCALISGVESRYGRELYAKLVAKEIAVREAYRSSIDNLWIDIIPIDGLSSSKQDRERVYSQADKLRHVVAMGHSNMHHAKSRQNFIAKNIYHFFDRGYWYTHKCEVKLTKLAKSTSYGSTEFVGAVTWGLYGVGECMPIGDYENFIGVEFEGELYNAPACWDFYLHGLYGDYMQLPPEEKRVSHEIQAWYI
ncbi:MAG: LicD family protein [Olegusella sp.]|nr:LicD family protein [Olegusella sp.]